MKLQPQAVPTARGYWTLGLMLALAPCPALAQVGPISTQSLFFNQASNANAANYFEADAGALHTDNVLLQKGGSRGDTLLMLGLLGNTSRIGTRLDYRAASDISVVKYLSSEFKTQPFGYFDGDGELRIVPGLFSWVARETFNQTALTANAPLTPDNLESVNYVTTGPRLALRPTLRTTIVVNAFYSYVDSSSKSPMYVNIDSHRYGGDVQLRRAFSSYLSAYLGARSEKVDFKDQVDNTNFRQDQGYAGLKLEDARTVLDVSGGYTKLHEDVSATVPGVAPRGSTWRLELSRLIRPTQRVSLRALRQIADSASLFRHNIDSPVPTSVPIRIVSRQPFTDKQYGATWRFEENRTALQFDLQAISDRFEGNPLSNLDAKLATALFARQLGPALNWDIGGSYERDVYGTGKSHRINAATSLRWQVGPRVRLRFLYAYSTLSPNGYHANQVAIIAGYALIPQRAAEAVTPPGMLPTAPMSSQPPPQ